jgi:hypothetical protein
VQKFGDFAPSDITRFLKRHFRENLSRLGMISEWGVDYKEKSCLLWSTTRVGFSAGNQIFGLSYARLQEDGWKPFTVTRECLSLATRKHPTTGIDELVTGCTGGFVRRQDLSSRSIDGTIPYTFNLTSPRLLMGVADATGKARGDQPIVIESAYVRSESTGAYTLSGNFTRDNLNPENYQFTLGTGADGFMLDDDFLDDTLLGSDEGSMEIAYSQPPTVGECRSLKFSLIQGGLDQDANLLEMGIEYTPAGQTRKSPVQSAQEES